MPHHPLWLWLSGGASPTLIWNDILQVKYSTFYWSLLHIFKNALVQATSTMHQSDIRRLVSTKRPEPTLICCVKSCAFYGRECRTNVAAHIGWVAFSSYRAHTKSIIPYFKLQITLSSFSHCLRQQIEAVRETYSKMDGTLNAKELYTQPLISSRRSCRLPFLM